MTAPTPSSRWRRIGWSAVALLLAAPLVAMQFTDEVNWTLFDFLVAGTLLIGAGVVAEVVSRTSSHSTVRWAAGLGLAATLLLLWVNGAVGILGAEDNDANLLYGVVVAIAFVGTLIARLRPAPMAVAMGAAGAAQAAITIGALIGGWAGPGNGPAEVLAVNGVFLMLWTASAALFHSASAARETSASARG